MIIKWRNDIYFILFNLYSIVSMEAEGCQYTI